MSDQRNQFAIPYRALLGFFRYKSRDEDGGGRVLLLECLDKGMEQPGLQAGGRRVSEVMLAGLRVRVLGRVPALTGVHDHACGRHGPAGSSWLTCECSHLTDFAIVTDTLQPLDANPDG